MKELNELDIIKEAVSKSNLQHIKVLSKMGKEVTLNISPEKFNHAQINLFDVFKVGPFRAAVLGFIEDDTIWCQFERDNGAHCWSEAKCLNDLTAKDIIKMDNPRLFQVDKLLEQIRLNPPVLPLLCESYKKFFSENFSSLNFIQLKQLYKKILNLIIGKEERTHFILRYRHAILAILTQQLEQNQSFTGKSAYYKSMKEICPEDEILIPEELDSYTKTTNLYSTAKIEQENKVLTVIKTTNTLVKENKFLTAINICQQAKKQIVDDEVLIKKISTHIKHLDRLNDSHKMQTKLETINPKTIEGYEHNNLLEAYNLELIHPTAINWPEVSDLYYYDHLKSRHKFQTTILEGGTNTIDNKSYYLYAVREKISRKVISCAYFVGIEFDEPCKLISLVTDLKERHNNHASLLLIAAIMDLKRKGYNQFKLESSPEGTKTYVKLGFNLFNPKEDDAEINAITSIEERISRIAKVTNNCFYLDLNNSLQVKLFKERVSELFKRHQFNLIEEAIESNDDRMYKQHLSSALKMQLTPIELEKFWIDIAKKGNVAFLEVLLTAPRMHDYFIENILSSASNSQFITLAIKHDQVTLFSYLLKYYSDDIEYSMLNNYYQTAKKEHKLELIKLFGFYYLLECLKKNELLHLELFLKEEKDTAYYLFHTAVVFGNLDLIYTFLSMGFSIDAPDLFGNTPLMLACKFGHEHLVKYFVEKKSANLFLRNREGKDAIAFAIYSLPTLVSYLATVKLNRLLAAEKNISEIIVIELLKLNPDLLYIHPDDYFDTLHYASMKGVLHLFPNVQNSERNRSTSGPKLKWYYEPEEKEVLSKKPKTGYTNYPNMWQTLPPVMNTTKPLLEWDVTTEATRDECPFLAEF